MSAYSIKADDELQMTLGRYSTGELTRKAPTQLFRQGEPPLGCYLIKRGMLRLSMDAPDGHTIVQRVVSSGYVVGLPATINNCPYSLNCDVIQDAELLYLSHQDLQRLMQSDGKTAMQILILLSNEVQAVRSEVATSSSRPHTKVSATEELAEWARNSPPKSRR
jgi:CRP-like cAMP-binding protein